MHTLAALYLLGVIVSGALGMAKQPEAATAVGFVTVIAGIALSITVLG